VWTAPSATGVDSYDLGEGFGHFGVATQDVTKLAAKIKEAGGTVRSRWW
jgi:lactoylglutathione lyase